MVGLEGVHDVSDVGVNNNQTMPKYTRHVELIIPNIKLDLQPDLEERLF